MSSLVSGVLALEVLTRDSAPSGRCTSQAQPEPKVFTAVSVNCCLKVSKSPKALLIASARAPVGWPPPLGDMQFQKKVWFHTCAALLNTPPWDLRTTSTRSMPANSVPSTSLLRLST